MSRELARPIPDKLSIWPVEGGRFGLDATFTGSSGFARAHRHERLLTAEDIRYQLRQELDDAWTLRLDPSLLLTWARPSPPSSATDSSPPQTGTAAELRCGSRCASHAVYGSAGTMRVVSVCSS